MGAEICFDNYLRSVIADCQKSMRLYTLMDDREQSQPDFFELKMQVVQPQPKYKEPSEQEGCKQVSTEPPIPVIEIYKYAQDHVLLMGKAGSGKSTALQKLLSVKAKASLDKQSTLIPVLIELRSWQTSVIDLIKNFFRKHRLRLDIQTIDEKYKSWASELLQQIAFAMMPQNNPDGLRLEIPKLEAENILAKFLDDEKFDKPRDHAKQWLDNLLKYHLIQIKTDQLIEFRHQLIQEYYAAEYLYRLVGKLSNEKLQKSYLNYLDWTESLALMLELVEGEELAVRVVRLALKVDLRLGARLAGAVKYGFQEKTVGWMVREIEERKIPQRFAIELLGETRSESVTNLLIANLKDSDYDVRWDAAEALVNISDEKAVDALIIALKDSDYDIRWNAAEALINIGNEKAVDTLIIALKDSDSDVRSTAAVALGNIGSEKAVNVLIIALKDSDSDVRSTAAVALSYILEAEALGKIGNKKVVESLIVPLKESDVWRDAAEILGKIGNKKVVESLIISIKDSNYFVRRDAAEALGKLAEADRNLPILTQQLPHLLTLIPTEASQQALSVITAIQSRCKYYNYAIAQTPLPSEDNPNPTTGNTYIFKATVGQVVENLTVQRDNIATQNNQKTVPES